MSACRATNARSARSLSVIASSSQVTVGQVDAFVGAQFRPRGRACVMRTCRRSGSVRSITPPMRPSSNQMRSPVWTSSNTCGDVQPIVAGIQHPPGAIARGRPTWRQFAREHEEIAPAKGWLLDCRNGRDARISRRSGVFTRGREVDARRDVARAHRLGPASVGADGDNLHHAIRTASVREASVGRQPASLFKNASGSSIAASAGVGGLRGHS